MEERTKSGLLDYLLEIFVVQSLFPVNQKAIDCKIAAGKREMESNAKLVHMDCKVQAFYNELNSLLPSLVRIGTDTFRPRIYTYRAVVVGNLSVKEAVGGETLLQWMKNMRVQNITEFAPLLAFNCYEIYVFAIFHAADIISIGKIIFHDLATASYQESRRRRK